MIFVLPLFLNASADDSDVRCDHVTPPTPFAHSLLEGIWFLVILALHIRTLTPMRRHVFAHTVSGAISGPYSQWWVSKMCWSAVLEWGTLSLSWSSTCYQRSPDCAVRMSCPCSISWQEFFRYSKPRNIITEMVCFWRADDMNNSLPFFSELVAFLWNF